MQINNLIIIPIIITRFCRNSFVRRQSRENIKCLAINTADSVAFFFLKKVEALDHAKL